MIRRGEPADLAAVAAIQRETPQASQWDFAGYLQMDFWVADGPDGVAGFLVARTVAPGERELLNLAVSPSHRRQGIATRLMQAFLDSSAGAVFLEVRESNQAAQDLYKSMGFQQLSLRRNYYSDPLEAAIVMKFHSC